MFEFLGISAVNPWLLAGGAAVAAPILIHLLSRRRFRIVDWAAMDFLLDADKRNRRRIRLEHLLLMLLRCLIVLLIAMLVARPFLQPTGLASMLGSAVRTERIVILDNSPSMQLQVDNRNVFDRARRQLIQFIRTQAQERPDDTLTLLTTSNPREPVIHGRYFDQAEELIAAIDPLSVSDTAADWVEVFDAAAEAIDEAEARGGGPGTRLVQVISDLRRVDWIAEDDGDARAGLSESLAASIERLAGRTQGMVLIDVGEPRSENLTIRSIEPREKTLVAEVPTHFEVTVANHGETEVQDLRVTVTVEEAMPLVRFIDRIPPGGESAASFSFTFGEPGSASVAAEIEPDALPADNRRTCVARVRSGVNVMLVDGDPSSEYGEAETFFLARALRPPGDAASGNVVEVITEDQFANADLAEQQVLFLANLYQADPAQLEALKRWVEAGGGLVIFLGDQVDAQIYNDQLGPAGAGLLPSRLTRVMGDETERTWANPTGAAANHPVMRVFAGTNNPFLRRVKVFQWWGVESPPPSPEAEAPESPASSDPAASSEPLEAGETVTTESDESIDAAGSIDVGGSEPDGRAGAGTNATELSDRVAAAGPTVVAALNDADRSPLVVERPLGDGRVMLITTSADGDWTSWPADASYVVTMLELVRYMARPTAGEGNVRVGEPLIERVDLARYRPEARLMPPDRADPIPLRAELTTAEDGTAPADASDLRFRFDDVDRAGLYRLELARHDGTEERRLFAANLDPAEGDLTPADPATLQRDLEAAGVELVSGSQYFGEATAGGRAELWRLVAVLLLVGLGVEQGLAWMFGRRR